MPAMLDDLLHDLVAANHILGHENVLDAFGHISVRHPERRDHFLMSQSRSPALVSVADIIEFDARGDPVDAAGRSPYAERYIHASVLAARPDVEAVVHNHSMELLPFSVSGEPLRALSHIGGILGGVVPVWDIADQFGDATNLLVVNLAQGDDLARALGHAPALLMRGHGAVVAAPTIRWMVYVALALQREAALNLAARQLGTIKYLSPGENAAMHGLLAPGPTPGGGVDRAWQYWCQRAGIAPRG